MDSGEVIGVMKKLGVFLIGALLLMFVSGLLGGIIGYQKGKARCADIPQSDTVVVTRIDTVTLVGEKIDSVIRYVSRPYPVAVYDTIVRGDTIFVSLPYEHRYWSAKDTLEIWYSGVDPTIDSARIHQRHTTEIIRQPYEVVKMPRLTADVGVAAFYIDKSINPCLIGETRYNAKKTTFSAYGAVDHNGRWAAGVGVTYRINLIK